MKRIVGAFLFLGLWTLCIVWLCIKYCTPRVYFTPGPECENIIISEINRAADIDIAVYSITNPGIADAIVAAHYRGANVRIITDRTMSAGAGSAIARFKNAGIPVRTNGRDKIMHNKFAIFNRRLVITGSYNWTTNASRYNAENCMRLYNPAVKFQSRFDYIWDLYAGFGI